MTEEFSGCLRMTELFNTPFETSLRVLLTLRVFGENITLDKIAAADFITIYARDFGVAAYNINGNNSLSFSEAASKRVLVRKAIKQLVLDRLVSAVQNKSGFTYEITAQGARVCDELIILMNILSCHKRFASILMANQKLRSSQRLMREHLAERRREHGRFLY